jgi:hypothetical protein
MSSSSYAWIVTRDHLAETDSSLTSRAGVTGPVDATDAQLTQLTSEVNCATWRAKDDDGEVYYSGLFVGDPESEDGFGPLDDFARPDAGATDIEYLQPDGTWKGL